ncbi:MAG: ABC transporter ATP-binding protein [Nitratireductor sp.]|nr:ABC transporter ATP-binding protein [Nitratireductor sp.]
MLTVRDLCVDFQTASGSVRALDHINFTVAAGEMLGIVGESGCGKSVLARAIMRLLRSPPATITAGELRLGDIDLVDQDEARMRELRGRVVSMVFQEPMTALNPKFSVGNQISEIFTTHFSMSRADAMRRSVDMLRMVGIPDPETRVHSYPFQMSGGMRQRVVIAMALAGEPQLVLADEPTTALDVTIQAQILDLIRDLNTRLGTSMILITHDLGVVAETVSKVIVMYAGQIVEMSTTRALFENPLHPYTLGLHRSIPDMAGTATRDQGPLPEIPGSVPSLDRLPHGCYFQGRCPHRMKICEERQPPFTEVTPGHSARCWLHA